MNNQERYAIRAQARAEMRAEMEAEQKAINDAMLKGSIIMLQHSLSDLVGPPLKHEVMTLEDNQ